MDENIKKIQIVYELEIKTEWEKLLGNENINEIFW